MPLLDQDLPARAQQGDENALAALIARMMPAIRKGAAECTAPGLDFDDAVQEGLIGLFHAVRGFDPAAGQTFTAYAAACIRHAQQDARRAALRKKHAPLNYSVPLPAADRAGAGTSRQKRGQCAGPCAPQAARCAHNLGFRRFACVIYQPAPSSA